MSQISLADHVATLIEKFGRKRVLSEIEAAHHRGLNCLTIISNGGLHKPPEEFLFGEIYYVTQGKMIFRDTESVEHLLDECLGALKEKLLSSRWDKIYLIPFGHVVLNMHIKMTVFRTLWMDTVDVFYFGNNNYGIIDRDSRNTLVEPD